MKYYIVREDGTAYEATSSSTKRDDVMNEVANSGIRNTEKGPMVLLFPDKAYLIRGEIKTDATVKKVADTVKDWINDATVFTADATHTSGNDYTFDPTSKEMEIYPLAGIDQAKKDDLVKGAKTWAESLKQQPAQQQPAYSQDQADSINALRAACESMGYTPVSWKKGDRVQATATP